MVILMSALIPLSLLDAVHAVPLFYFGDVKKLGGPSFLFKKQGQRVLCTLKVLRSLGGKRSRDFSQTDYFFSKTALVFIWC
jgi:hypothetical protein